MPKRKTIAESDLAGFKYFKKILPVLDQLHDYATDNDIAGNRKLHFDQYICLQLLYFFNPIVSSMRGLVQASTLKKVQKQLNVCPTSLGSFSDAAKVFDADQLKPVIEQLGRQLKPLKHDSRLEDLPGKLIAVDGSQFKALSQLVDHMFNSRKFKLHTHFEPLTGVPASIDLTKATASEVDNLLKRLVCDRVYVKDRGYACFKLLQAIDDIGSHFVCRVRDDSAYRVIEQRELTDKDIEDGIISDQVVELGCDHRKKTIKKPVRLIKISCKPYSRKEHSSRGGHEQGEFILIATNLMDVEANVIGLIYKKRWTIELFFRFFKHVLGCNHLLSHRKNGIELQVYVAVIVCMLIALWTCRKPTLRTIEMLRFYFTGWADEQELADHIAGLKNIDD